MEKKLNQYIYVSDLQGKIVIGSQYIFILDNIFFVSPPLTPLLL